ncbi:MAG: hypothetical protein QF405_07665, partial [Roseibacillus sp.]|nr:hypothetical protein [Roseibacillus sp.]
NFTTTVVGGSGDDTIHLGGDPPPLVFDPPAVEFTPPPIQVATAPILKYDEVTRNFGDYVFEYDFGWWFSFFGSNSRVANVLAQYAEQAVRNTIQSWFDSWRGNIPNMRYENYEVGSYNTEVQTTRYGFWWWSVQRTRVVVRVENLRITYETGRLVEQLPTQLTPAPVEFDPPPYAYAPAAQLDVGQIRGRVIIDGGSTFENEGDSVILHNSSGLSDAGLLTNRQVPRMESLGRGPDGELQFEQARDENGPILDSYLSVEGLGLDVPDDGFEGRDGVSTYGVLLTGIETLDLRLADEASSAHPGDDRSDSLDVRLGELRGSESRDEILGSVADEDRQTVNLQIVAGAGNDEINLRSTTGETTVYGGAGDDSVTLGNNGSLADLGGTILFDGDAHIDENTSAVPNSEIDGISFPNIFTGTGPGFTASTFVDGSGSNTVEYYNARYEPVVFPGANGSVQVRPVALASDGEIETDFIRDEGVPALDESNRQIYIDSAGQQTAAATDGDGFPNRELWESAFSDEEGQPNTNRQSLFIDPAGVRTGIDPSFLLFDRLGGDFNVYRQESDGIGPSGRIQVQVSVNGRSWVTASQVDTERLHGENDLWVDSNSVFTYDIGGNTNVGYRYLRIRGVNDGEFRLDAVGILAGHGGAANLQADTAFLTNISDATSGSIARAAVVSAPDGLFDYMGDDEQVIYSSSAESFPAVLEANRSLSAVDFERTSDLRLTDPGSAGRDTLLIDGQNQSDDLTGSLDRFIIGVERVGGTTVTVEDTVADDEGAATFYGALAAELQSEIEAEFTITFNADTTTIEVSRSTDDSDFALIYNQLMAGANQATPTDVSATRTYTLPAAVTSGEQRALALTYGGATAGAIDLHLGATSDVFTSGCFTEGAVFNLSETPVDSADVQAALKSSDRTVRLLTPGDDYSVVGREITLLEDLSSGSELVVTYVATSSAQVYFGGEQVYHLADPSSQELTGASLIEAVRNHANSFRPDDAVTFAGGEIVYGLFTGDALRDPFGQIMGRKPGDPVEHFQGDSILHHRGEVRRFLGGEFAFDEAGAPVVNGDGSIFRRLPGQVMIHDRRDLVFAPDFFTFTFDADNAPGILSYDLADESGLALRPNLGIAGWQIDFARSGSAPDPLGGANIDYAPDRLVSVVISSERGIFALDDSEYTFDPGSGQLVITADLRARISGETTVEANLALLSFHRNGDALTYFGDEEVRDGDPVVEESGGVFAVLTDSTGNIVTYTDKESKANSSDRYVFLQDSDGNRLIHARGAPVFASNSSDGLTITLEQSNALTPQRYAGNEAQIWFGGEQVYYESDDPVVDGQGVQRISDLGIPGQIYFANGIFPQLGGGDVVDPDDVLRIRLGDGDDAFTIYETPASGLVVDTGDGEDRIGVRRAEGDATLNIGAGDDLVAIGSQAGFWDIAFTEGERPAYRPLPAHAAFINAQGSLDLIDATVTVNGGEGSDQVILDDTLDSDGAAGEMTSAALTGLGMGGSGLILYN